MERYSYFFKSEIQNENSSFLGKEIKVDYMHAFYYKNMKDCIRSALYYNTIDMRKRTPCYLKILNNAEVVEYIHKSNKDYLFGFLHLYFEESVLEPIRLFSNCETLYRDMLDCVCAVKCDKESNVTDTIIKVAYFIMLTPDNIVQELHSGCL